MNFEPSILAKFKQCLLDAFLSTNDIHMFTMARMDQLGVSILDVTSENEDRETRIFQYLERLNSEFKAKVFFDLCWEHKPGFPNFPEAIEIKRWVEAQLVVGPFGPLGGSPVNMEDLILKCHLLRSGKLPFIARAEVKEALLKQIKGNESRNLLLNGESKVGLSYIRYYLEEIARATNAFQLINVNFKKLYRRVKGQIQMVHIAQFITGELHNFDIDFDLDREHSFKYEEFLPALKEYFSESDGQYLLFFDQFDISYSEEVGAFITELVEGVWGNVENYFIMLAGFTDAKDWDFELIQSVPAIKLEPFQEQEVLAFLKEMYQFLDQQFELEFSLQELIEVLRQNESFLAKDLYTADRPAPNVTDIGRNLADWLKRFKEKIAATNG
ncbi:MAG: hypothetical protein AAF694_26330 [Bacteroidota bacterium]